MIIRGNMAEYVRPRKAEKAVAVGSFLAAVALAFFSVYISEDHDVAGGVLMMCAQFLTLTATIFGIDYRFSNPITSKLSQNGKQENSKGHS